MDYYTQSRLTDIHKVLKEFLDKERIRLRAHTREAHRCEYSREMRQASHHVLAGLVPGFKSLDKLLLQPEGHKKHWTACEQLATALITQFIADTRVPDNHPVWALELGGHKLRALVQLSGDAKDGSKWQEWLSAMDKRFPGLAATLQNYETEDLGSLRAEYLVERSNANAERKERLQSILAKVKGFLSAEEYELLTAAQWIGSKR
jgi:hypothetical protein